MKTNPLKIFWNLLEKKEQLQCIALIFTFATSALIEAAALSVLYPFVSLLVNPEAFQQSTFFETFYRLSGASSKKEFLIISALTIFLIYLLKNLFSALVIFFQSKFVFGTQQRVANRLFLSYLHKPYPFFLQRTKTDLMKIVVTDVGSFFEVVVMSITIIFSEMIIVIGVLVLLILVNPISAICSALILSVCIFIYFRFFRTNLVALGAEQQKRGFELFSWASRGFGGIKEIKISGGEDEIQKCFETAGGRYINSLRTLRFINELPRLFLELMAIGGMLLVCFLIFLQGYPTEVVVPIVGLFAAATFRLIPSFSKILTSLNLIIYHLSLSRLIEEEYSTGQIEENEPSAQPSRLAWKQDLILKNVTFRYPNRPDPVLSNINLTIEKGDWLAVIGPSGVGKSTLVDLLLGLIEPTKGEILVDGEPLHEVSKSWERLIGYVPQNIFLHNGTLRQNIAFGMPAHKIEDRAVLLAIEKAQLSDFIHSLPEGLDTKIGDGGIHMSGGQRQRLGIARALYRDSEILIFDEATASLDAEVEKQIFNETKNIFEGKTVILISHQPLPVAFMKKRFDLEKNSTEN